VSKETYVCQKRPRLQYARALTLEISERSTFTFVGLQPCGSQPGRRECVTECVTECGRHEYGVEYV